MPISRSSNASTVRYGLELHDASMGFVHSFEGGDATADVAVEPPGADGIARKHLGNVRYEEIVLTCGANMSQPFYDLVAAALKETSRTHFGPSFSPNGAVVAYDAAEVWRLHFFHAFVSEVGFPALDASSKDAATLCVKLPRITQQGTRPKWANRLPRDLWPRTRRRSGCLLTFV